MEEQLQALQTLLWQEYGPRWPEYLPALLRRVATAGELAEAKPRRRPGAAYTPAEVEAILAQRMGEAAFLGQPAPYRAGFAAGVQLTLALLGRRSR